MQRRDVIADLGLFDGQRARLAASLERAQQECDQEIRNLVSAGLPSRQDSSIRKQPVGPSLDAQAYVARRLYNQQMYDAVNRELTDGQLQRLDELDLRYRGPLALVDEKVAVRIGLTPEQAVEVAPAYLSYLEHLRDFRRGLNWLCAQAVITRGAGRAPVPMEMIEAAYDSAALRLRQRIGAALLAALMPSKGQRWQALLGAPFVFRIAD